MAKQTKGRNSAENSTSPRDERLALALARGMTRVDAANECGMGLRTVYTRLEDPAFRRMVTDHRARILDEAVGMLASIGTEAIAELRKLVANESAGIRLRAAAEILDSMIKVGSYADLNQRITEVERRLDVDGREA